MKSWLVFRIFEKHLPCRLIKAPKKQLSRNSSGARLCPNQVVTPAKAGVQLNFMAAVLNHLDSGFHRNDKKVPAVSLLDDSETEPRSRLLTADRCALGAC
jgi:hypothetical protein